MNREIIRIGIIGVHPEKGWAAFAHIPALQKLPEYRITVISNHDIAIANAAAEKFSVPYAVNSADALINHPEVDLVAVTVKAPNHRELVEEAIKAGKMVFSEWPLTPNLEEAISLRDLAQSRGVPTVIGLQGRALPVTNFVRDLIRQGHIGHVYSTTLVSSGFLSGDTITEAQRYTLDPLSGANMITVPFGHTVDFMLYALEGQFEDFVAKTATLRKVARIEETGEEVPMKVHDQLAVSGLLDNGIFANIHFRGGLSGATNFNWEINGSAGDIVITAPQNYQARIRVQIARHGEKLSDVDIPEEYIKGFEDGASQGIALAYQRIASDIIEGTHLAPTFDDAVQLHSLIDRVLCI